jgi:hypothetical protein
MSGRCADLDLVSQIQSQAKSLRVSPPGDPDWDDLPVRSSEFSCPVLRLHQPDLVHSVGVQTRGQFY